MADDLFPLFDKYGEVVDVFIPRDRRYILGSKFISSFSCVKGFSPSRFVIFSGFMDSEGLGIREVLHS